MLYEHQMERLGFLASIPF